MRESLSALIQKVAASLVEADAKVLPASGQLYGVNGAFDSIGLVSFIVALEQALEQELEITVVLADDKAMSQRRSPFRSVDALVAHIEGLLAEGTSHAA